jgi:hypothetical protein
MFNKEYPKSCTMIDTSFEDSKNSKNPITTGSGITFGCGHWQDKFYTGIFYTSIAPGKFYTSVSSKVFSNTYCPPIFGFRVGVYV